jgi:hypothetical protein
MTPSKTASPISPTSIGANHHHPIDQSVCQDGAQANAVERRGYRRDYLRALAQRVEVDAAVGYNFRRIIRWLSPFGASAPDRTLPQPSDYTA